MRIGELATRAGVSTDTVRFYERSGWLPRPARRDNDYREYGEADAEHLRLLIDLRRLDVPLEDAARIAAWCHSGHCAETDAALPALIAERRAAIGERIEGLHALDARLADLERHLGRSRRSLTVVGFEAAGACCDAAGAVVDSAEGRPAAARAAPPTAWGPVPADPLIRRSFAEGVNVRALWAADQILPTLLRRSFDRHFADHPQSGEVTEPPAPSGVRSLLMGPSTFSSSAKR